MVRIRCNRCHSLFKVHRGFVGGFCRCTECGRFLLVHGSTPDETSGLEQLVRAVGSGRR